MPVQTFLAVSQQLVVQSVDLARLIGRDILQVQRSQLILGWLMSPTVVDRPGSAVKRWGRLSRKCGGRAKCDRPCRKQCIDENSTS
ncbi:hypothetical protein BRAS3843_1090026 [Bradyrhizobium sp. STM 3843]|nr:hypothetical protein BRAS3843_1090026 [Bradyrhizobium sp. STM 3843]